MLELISTTAHHFWIFTVSLEARYSLFIERRSLFPVRLPLLAPGLLCVFLFSMILNRHHNRYWIVSISTSIFSGYPGHTWSFWCDFRGLVSGKVLHYRNLFSLLDTTHYSTPWIHTPEIIRSMHLPWVVSLKMPAYLQKNSESFYKHSQANQPNQQRLQSLQIDNGIPLSCFELVH